MKPLEWYAVISTVIALLLHVVSTGVRSAIQKALFFIAVPLFALASCIVLSIDANVFAGLFTLCVCLLIVNHARLIERRMHEAYLLTATQGTATVLSIALIVFGELWFLTVRQLLHVSAEAGITVLAAISLVVSLILLATIARRLHARTVSDSHLSDKDLPSITVAIPARNETHALTTCLQSLIASDYPKLEIIVLDDCSQDKTAEVIRGFAQDGVRFIEGKLVPDDGHWLSKNYAYEQLAQAAVGEYILFCSAHTRLEPASIRRLVTEIVTRKQAMLTVLPEVTGLSLGGFMIQPLRNWWQLVFPREWFGYAPAKSSCWMIDRKKLQAIGGFASASRKVSIEAFLARIFSKQREYLFMPNGRSLGVVVSEPLKSQYKTTLRVRYPEARRRPENVLAWLLFEILILCAPFVALWSGLQAGYTTALYLGAAGMTALLSTYAAATWLTYRRATLLAFVTFPVSLVAEIVLLVVSMIEYEFGNIAWKGRNVCLPVMHVIPHLPALPDESKRIDTPLR